MVQFINTTTKVYTRQELLCCTDDLITAYLHDFKLPKQHRNCLQALIYQQVNTYLTIHNIKNIPSAVFASILNKVENILFDKCKALQNDKTF